MPSRLRGQQAQGCWEQKGGWGGWSSVSKRVGGSGDQAEGSPGQAGRPVNIVARCLRDGRPLEG